MKPLRVLVACEFSGVVRDAFAKRGHDAWSCDIVPAKRNHSVQHIMGDVLTVLDRGWDLMIAHPPCTHLACSGAAWMEKKRKDGRQQRAIGFFMALGECGIPRYAIENPVGIMSKHWRKPDQIIQPWQFGDEAQKTTCLWLKNLPPLTHTSIVGRGEMVTFKSGAVMPKWYADAWHLPPGLRAKVRNRTFPGIADAMADQWGSLTKQEAA